MYINVDIKKKNKFLVDIKLIQTNLNNYTQNINYKILGFSILDDKWIELINIHDKIENFDYNEKLINEVYNLLLKNFNEIEILKYKNRIILLSDILEQAKKNILDINTNIADENSKYDSYEL